MGKKNKQKKDNESTNKNMPHQRSQAGPSNQDVRGGGQNSQQAASPSQQQNPRQRGGQEQQQNPMETGREERQFQQQSSDAWSTVRPQHQNRGGQSPQHQNPKQSGGQAQKQNPKQTGNEERQFQQQNSGARGAVRPQNPKQSAQQVPQQSALSGEQRQQQSRDGQQYGSKQSGGQAQEQTPKQAGAWGGKQPQNPKQSAQQVPQQSAWSGEQRQQQNRDGQQYGSRQSGGQAQEQTPKQAGAWGAGRPQNPKQSAQQVPQQSAWSGEQRQQQNRDGQQHGSRQQQEGFTQQRNPIQQKGGRGNQSQQPGQCIQQQMKELCISDVKPLPSKEKSCNGIVRGTLGTPGVVEVNYLKLDLEKMPNEAYHYDVTVTPDKPKKFLRPAFEQCRLEIFPNTALAFDGMKNCYTLQQLKTPIEHTVQVPDSNNRMKELHVRIQETDNCKVDLSSLRTYQNEKVSDKPMRALQVLEVVLASNNHERGLRVGRSFFRRPDDAYDLQDGYEAWTGLYQAAILGELPLLNVDIAHKSFPCESTIIDYLKGQNCNVYGDISENRNVCSYLKGINIVYTPPKEFGASPKQYKVLDIGEPASKKQFTTDDGKQFTVSNYFASRGKILQYPNLNCITVGSVVRKISLPMELCSIPANQALNRKDKDRQVQNMIRYAATSTNKRKQKIMELLRFFEHNSNPIIREFGLRIGSNFIQVPMRVLSSPLIEYFRNQTISTFKGAWRMDRNQFLITSNPNNGYKWAILYEDRKCSHHNVEDFKADIIKASRNLRMNLQDTAEIQAYNYSRLQTILRDFAKNKYDLVFVVLANVSNMYSKIKQVAELEVGLLTQCIKEKTVTRTKKDQTIFSNILLKVNAKLNGTNHKIVENKGSNLMAPVKNVMYLGADVTHPSPDQRYIPSVVGVAASHDSHGACYNCQYRLQKSTVEIIEDMESIVSRHLQVYYSYQKSYPSQIIYYRDGVSDGQFPHVERAEIPAIRRACKKVGCNAKLTCIIVVKRHHTRFFPLSKPQNDRDFNNVQPGTVVDQYITHPNEVQFFMVSHQSIQGTARPTRYNVILDDSKFDINLLQKLTYNLCHLFPRCNRSVSYPAPAYLAHLVAFRGRVYLEGARQFTDLRREYEKRTIKPEFMDKSPMYFI